MNQTEQILAHLILNSRTALAHMELVKYHGDRLIALEKLDECDPELKEKADMAVTELHNFIKGLVYRDSE